MNAPELVAALDEAIRVAERLRPAQLVDELRELREQAGAGHAVRRDTIGALIRRVDARLGDAGLPLLAALGAVARAATP